GRSRVAVSLGYNQLISASGDSGDLYRNKNNLEMALGLEIGPSRGNRVVLTIGYSFMGEPHGISASLGYRF
ncbi:MAG: hypothetical protein LBB24_00805, partial [Rickettsiales bacterium]|nr:hypothetical protein [Rickettsiales bacterium]